MKCPFCEEEGKKSRVTPHGESVTLLGHAPHYDEEGEYHNHDPNTRTAMYSCSEGHTWQRRYKRECPSCDYGKGTEEIKLIQTGGPPIRPRGLAG